MRVRVVVAAVLLPLALWALLIVLPLLWLVLSSFKSDAQIGASAFGWPENWSLDVFTRAWDKGIGDYFVNTVIVPGLTYGWAPEGTKLIAYAAQKTGRVVVMDASGSKKEVPGSKEAILPAWSQDLGRLAWLQKQGRRVWELRVSRVSVS